MTKKKFLEYRSDFLLLTVALFWGVTFLMVKEAIETTPVFAFLFFRFGLATVIMGVLAFKHFTHIDRKSVMYGCVLGVFLFLGFATQTFALKYISSSIVAFITGLNVIIVPFLAFVIFKDRVRKNVLLASFVALFGLYFLTMSGTLTFAYPEFLALFCALFFALQIAFTGYFSTRADVYLLVFFQFLVVTCLSLVSSLFYDNVTFSLAYDYNFFKALLITAIFATVYAFLIQTYMQQFTTPSKTAIIFTMEPVSAAVYGNLVGGEVLTNIQLFGAILIISATLLAELKFKKS